MNELRGVVMCGGKSTRMGRDKGLIAIAKTCWAAYMADKLKAVALPVAVSINIDQREAYQAIFSADELILDSLNISGPLNGLLSVHASYPGDDLLLVACDMINLQAETIERLINTYKNTPGFDCYVYQNENFAEPFCAIYTAAYLNTIAKEAGLSSEHGLSFQHVLNESSSLRLPVTEKDSFLNYNTPE